MPSLAARGRHHPARGQPANPKLQAVISADKGVEYGKVVEIIDIVKQNGVGAFALDIERGTPPVVPAQTP